jgi:hypothetical protein
MACTASAALALISRWDGNGKGFSDIIRLRAGAGTSE